MQNLELRIPPPLVGLVVALGMWAAARFVPSLAFDGPLLLQMLAVVIVSCGAAVSAAGVVSFRRAKTTINPLKPESSTTLVTSGIYSVTRNPMYLGMVVVLLAWAVYLASLPALVGPLAFGLYIQRFQIIPEERAMAALFGDAFAEYAARVRRWI